MNKKRILYLDCFSGISGDMFLGALLDLGVPLAAIDTGLASLGLSNEYHLHAEKITRSGIAGTSFQVHLNDSIDHDHDHDHHHHHGHNVEHHHSHDTHHSHGRTYADIKALIEQAPLKASVRSQALAVFREIGVAEAAVHGVELDQVHFHEVGAVDSIVDIVGTALALDALNIGRIVVSPITDGSGMIKCQHGLMPVPVPAVMKMLEQTDIPYITGTSDTELVTPTGFGLVKTLASAFGSMPAMKRIGTGYGFGQREIGRLNALRIVMGEETGSPAAATNLAWPDQTNESTDQINGFDPLEIDEIILLSCHVDNTTPEQLGYVMNMLLDEGALDVSYSPLLMKKNRPGQLLTVVVDPALEKLAVATIFKQTGTIGIRRERIERHVMQRSFSSLELTEGSIRIKNAQWQDILKVYPEYEDLATLAESRGISLDLARQIVIQALSDSDQQNNLPDS